jgi:ornithine cyclodeaminase/alanine dehydrogenase-like protein (mu-crystallin family)
MEAKRLGVGFIGSGFNARFHMRGWAGVRDADVLGVWSPNRKNAESAAAYARSTLPIRTYQKKSATTFPIPAKARK